MWSAEDEQMPQNMPAGVKNERLAPVSRRQATNIVCRKIVKKRRPIFTCQLDLRAVGQVDHSHAVRKRRVFQIERHGHQRSCSATSSQTVVCANWALPSKMHD